MNENIVRNQPALAARELCQDAISEFKRKSDHNKRETMLCFIVSMSGTLAAPLFVALGDEMAVQFTVSPFFLSKFIPSFLSVGAAFSTAWLQMRKPQQLWSLYRTAQRELEEHFRAYQFGLNDFADLDCSDKLLVARISDIYRKIHTSWVPLVPSPDHTVESGNARH